MLMPDERALFAVYCNDHPIAVCHQCAEALTFERIGADIVMGTRDFCPTCRADLTLALRRHLADCTFIRVQDRERRDVVQESEPAPPRRDGGGAPALDGDRSAV
jgi:hypothetical protein